MTLLDKSAQHEFLTHFKGLCEELDNQEQQRLANALLASFLQHTRLEHLLPDNESNGLLDKCDILLDCLDFNNPINYQTIAAHVWSTQDLRTIAYQQGYNFTEHQLRDALAVFTNNIDSEFGLTSIAVRAFVEDFAESNVIAKASFAITFFDKDGEEIDDTEVDELDEMVIWQLFEEFGHTKKEGDYYEFEVYNRKED